MTRLVKWMERNNIALEGVMLVWLAALTVAVAVLG